MALDRAEHHLKLYSLADELADDWSYAVLINSAICGSNLSGKTPSTTLPGMVVTWEKSGLIHAIK